MGEQCAVITADAKTVKKVNGVNFEFLSSIIGHFYSETVGLSKIGVFCSIFLLFIDNRYSL